MRTLLALFLFISSGFIVHAQQTEQADTESMGETRYITDDLYTYLHAGPGRNYRILGSVMAGTKVLQLQVSDDKDFVEIIDDKQRTGWVDASFVTSKESIRNQLPVIQEGLKIATTALDDARQNNELLNQQIADMTTQNARLKKELQEMMDSNIAIQKKLDSQDQSAQMEWLTRGGIIALVSVLLGVIIAYLPKKRRRNDQWM